MSLPAGDFHADFMRGYEARVTELLDKAGLPVLIYAGAADFHTSTTI